MNELTSPTCVHGVPYDRPCDKCSRESLQNAGIKKTDPTCVHGVPYDQPCEKCSKEDELKK
ncbi:hypothetical protein KA089_00785 [Candidatus Woesebacteria bacterium]|nr:hypothetical protein [Candidatus Woesebacteria bacterium]